jgi:hypothetical protein
MKAAVLGVFVFAAAIVAHREFGHGGQGPIVGNVEDDAVARAAVRAVGEGIFEAAVAGRASVGEAGIADADIGRDEGEGRFAPFAVANDEAGLVERSDLGAIDGGDADQRRRFAMNGGEERLQLIRRPLGLDENAPGRIENKAGEAVAASKIEDPGAESDALDDALNAEPRSNCAVGRDGVGVPFLERFRRPLSVTQSGWKCEKAHIPEVSSHSVILNPV